MFEEHPESRYNFESMENPFYYTKELLSELGITKGRQIDYITFTEDEERDYIKENKQMNKKDLKQGSIIETEYGAQYILVDKTFINLETGCYLNLTDYDNDLVSPLGAPIISKIFIPERTHKGYKNYIDKNLKWTWERKNDIQFNIGDIVKGNFYDRTKGRIGKIVEKVNDRYLVEYDKYFEGDNGSF